MKTIILTITLTLSIITATVAFAGQAILGLAGFTVVTVDKLHKLTAASQVLDKVKVHHSKRKLRTSKRFVKKASRKVASTAVAAATIGTVAVAATMIGLEVADYCEQQQEINELDNVLNGTNQAFDFNQCVDEASENTQLIFEEVKQAAIAAGSNAFESIKSVASDYLASARSYAVDVFEFYDRVTENIWNDALALLQIDPDQRN